MKSHYLKNIKGDNFKGPLIFISEIFQDERGFFTESWNKRSFNNWLSQDINFVQDNHSLSTFNVLRGLHFQVAPHSQGKLIRCLQGEIYDVGVDLRINSSTFGNWFGVTLSSANRKQLWLPSGFAHGFLTMSSEAQVMYKVSDYWDQDSEMTLRWNDPTISIKWPLISDLPKISSKDNDGKCLDEIHDLLYF
jgi:dTDP-4-dehydrorhamnose 3,5-epimerase